jgi:hypothetical protein
MTACDAATTPTATATATDPDCSLAEPPCSDVVQGSKVDAGAGHPLAGVHILCCHLNLSEPLLVPPLNRHLSDTATTRLLHVLCNRNVRPAQRRGAVVHPLCLNINLRGDPGRNLLHLVRKRM